MRRKSIYSALLLLIFFFSFQNTRAQIGECSVLAPNQVMISDLDAHNVTFSWPNIGQANILIEVQTGQSGWIPVASLAPGSTGYTIQGLEMCTDYEMRMTISCLSGFPLPYSIVRPFSTICCGSLSAFDVEVVSVTQHTIALDWVDNGAAAWLIRWQKADGSGPLFTDSASVSNYTIIELEKGIAYKISVNSWCSFPYPGPNSGMNWGEEFVVTTSNKKGDSDHSTNPLSIAPNPFSTNTDLHVNCNEAGPVNLRVFDLKGKLIATPVIDRYLEKGRYTFNFDGSLYESGLYNCVLIMNEGVFQKKISIVH